MHQDRPAARLRAGHGAGSGDGVRGVWPRAGQLTRGWEAKPKAARRPGSETPIILDTKTVRGSASGTRVRAAGFGAGHDKNTRTRGVREPLRPAPSAFPRRAGDRHNTAHPGRRAHSCAKDRRRAVRPSFHFRIPAANCSDCGALSLVCILLQPACMRMIHTRPPARHAARSARRAAAPPPKLRCSPQETTNLTSCARTHHSDGCHLPRPVRVAHPSLFHPVTSPWSSLLGVHRAVSVSRVVVMAATWTCARLHCSSSAHTPQTTRQHHATHGTRQFTRDRTRNLSGV
jgi:hypothetical protein